MDHFGNEHLRELLDGQGLAGPAISIYLGRERNQQRTPEERLRLRGLVEKARAELDERLDKREVAALIDPLAIMVDDDHFWRLHTSEGLCILRSGDFLEVFDLPVRFEDRVQVNDNFYTRPLIEYLQSPERYWVLGLSQGEVRLWEGNQGGCWPIDLAGVPRSLQDALGYQVAKDALDFRQSPGAGVASAGRGAPWARGRGAIFYGQGYGKDDNKMEREKFFRMVAEGLQEMLRGQRGPLILATVEINEPIFRGVCGIENLASQAIHANVDRWSSDQIHAHAWPIASSERDRLVQRALEHFEVGFGRGKLETDLTNIGQLLVANQVRMLIMESGREAWGRYDRTMGVVELSPNGARGAGSTASVDVIDELAEAAVLHGAEVIVVPPGRIQVDSGVAAILRGT